MHGWCRVAGRRVAGAELRTSELYLKIVLDKIKLLKSQISKKSDIYTKNQCLYLGVALVGIRNET